MPEWSVETSSLRLSRWEDDTFATCNVVALDTKTERDVTIKGKSGRADSNEVADVVSRVELGDDGLAISLKGCRDARNRKFHLQSFQCYSCCAQKLRISEIRKTTQALTRLASCSWKKYWIPDPGFELATTCDTSQSRLENIHMQDSVLRERTSVSLVDASGCMCMCIVNSASTPNSGKLRR
ncbi:hypothetical protein COCC4DRAFT_141566 [Bipolaris maydis ATCC 48331]|uniref:Uncharacterized protein n=2 Tax=Cochliobolus heterostrophus TaxID=5016 RepID=M2TYZ6_COCH5|nr:uncharacterized protein COCC4DRAFT_141566 [Bipolaris maydis ATCC 48331]EMD87061.1 hypothetical protein COCHEDRAFT_1114651 [Bipolaris maydis C5]ENI03946.1 hypothetical protein COCC4DRAFT_141566 [Bipolaris maydis ATCC 48331]